MIISALQTARAGSKSVPNKNTHIYDDKPLFLHNLIQSSRCSLINGGVYVSTDDKRILDYEWGYNDIYKTIKRPAKLCKDDSSHLDAMLHGLTAIEKDIKKRVDVIVVLLGNTPHAYTNSLTEALEQFQTNFYEFDSCMSVGKYNMFNPYRAFGRCTDGAVRPIVDHTVTNRVNVNDKDAFNDTYFFNGSFWIMKRQTLIEHNGVSVFPWLGNRIMPYLQPADCQEVDAYWQLALLDTLVI